MNPNEKLLAALKALLSETDDWADALCGERPSLDDVRKQAQDAINEAEADRQ